MDPVSKLLAEREASLPRLLPWVVIATLLHASVAAGVFVAARSGSSPPAHLPAVSVKLVRPTRPPARRRPDPQPAAAEAAPVPTAAPQATAVPPPPEPKATAAAPSTTTSEAMPAAKSTPAPTRKPAPSTGGATRAGGGLSLGGGDGGADAGIPSDFHFTYYINRMLALIESRWYKPPVAAGTSARVRFRILKSGGLESIELEESSGVPSFDRAVLRALYAANPLPPLPPAYLKGSLTVHLRFSE